MKKIFYFMLPCLFWYLFSKEYLINFKHLLFSSVFAKIRSKLSKSFFSHYFDLIDINRKGILPSVMARNVNISVEGFYSYFEQLNN